MRDMKNSGVEWVGQIPENWDSLKLKHCVDCLDNERIPIDSAKRVDGPYPYWGAGSITDYVNDYIFDEDLVLLGEDGAPFFDPLRDVAHHINGKCWINNHIHVLRSRDKVIINSFLTYWLNSVDYKTYINGSILNKLTQSNMMRINVFTPSLEEQNIIASFLDAKCAEIDALTSDIQKEIETLQEYRKSVITEAVTKGLDPNVEMKDSGVEWIGVIPNDWIICRVKNVIESNKDGIKIGPFGSSLTNRIVENGGYKVYAQSNLIRGDFFSTKHTITEDVFFELRSYEVLPGDICLSMMGTIGKCLQVPANIERGIMDSHLIKVRLNPIMLPSFFSYVYDKDNSSVCYTQMKMDSKGSIMDGLNTSIVKNLVLPLPPKDEQQRIIDYLDTKCFEIDSIIADKQKQLETLAEYRKSLIYEYVTGKKEVQIC